MYWQARSHFELLKCWTRSWNRGSFFLFFATFRQPLPESEDKILLCLSDRREHNEGLRGIINIGLGDGPGGILLESSSFWFSSESRLNVTAVIRVQQNSLFHISFLAFSLLCRLLSSAHAILELLSPTPLSWPFTGMHICISKIPFKNFSAFFSPFAKNKGLLNDECPCNKLYMVCWN